MTMYAHRQYGESNAEWADLHGIEPEPEAAPTEHCDLHGLWVYDFAGPGECPTCFDLSETARRHDAWWDYNTSQHR